MLAEECNTLPLCTTQTITVIFANTAPAFSPATSTSITLPFGSSSTFTLPSYSDAEGDPVTLVTSLAGGSSYPSFMTESSSGTVYSYLIAPSNPLEAGTFSLTTSICDMAPACSTFDFTVIVTDYPVITTTSPTVLNVDMQNPGILSLSATDPAGFGLTLSMNPTLPF